MKVSVITLGCKVNQYESQAMLSRLAPAGFTPCEPDEPCDVVIVNSCTVTAMSDRKVRQALRRARRDHPDAVVVLTGCMPQAFPETAERLTEADIVLGNSNRASLLPDILKFLSERRRIVDIVPHGQTSAFEPMRVEHFYDRTRAFVKIEDGCNRFCSYCIIPYARGRVRSKRGEDLARELDGIAANGYREVVLTGINLSCYGQDIGRTLCDAVEDACARDGILRVRLGSLEPEQLGEPVIERLRRQPKLCPQFHLSLQSGCDDTLRRMNRHYTADEYRRIVKNLRAAFPNAAITTDWMVGFPGETDAEFETSLTFVREIGFAKIHVFAYSRRPGTAADRAQGQVSPETKERRSHAAVRAAQELRSAYFQSQTGLREPVLFERECEPGVFEGYTENYTPVRTASGQSLSGLVVPVRITGVREDFCTAQTVQPVTAPEF